MAQGIQVQERPVFTEGGGQVRPGPMPVADPTGPTAALGRIGDAMASLGEVLYKHDQEAKVLQADLDIAKGFQDLTQKVSEEPDWEKANKLFQDGAAAIQSQTTPEDADGHVQARIAERFARTSLNASATVARDVMQKKSEAYRANMDAWGESALRLAQTDPENDPNGAPVLTNYKRDVDDQAAAAWRSGAMSQYQAQKWRQSMREKGDYNRALDMVKDNPVAAKSLLEETVKAEGTGEHYRNFIDLDPEKRITLISMADHGLKSNRKNLDELRNLNLNIAVTEGADAANKHPSLSDGYLVAHGADAQDLQEFKDYRAAGNTAHEYYQRMVSANTADISKLMNEVSDKIGKQGGEYTLKILPLLQNERAKIEEQRQKDPAGYVVQNFLPSGADPNADKAKAWGDLPPDRRVAEMSAKQQALGIQPRILTVDEANGVAVQFGAADPASRISTAKAFIQKWGRFSNDAVKELVLYNKVPVDFAIIGSHSNPRVQQEIAEATEAKMTTTRQALGDRAKTIDQTLNSQWQDFASRVPNPESAYWQGVRKAIQNVAYLRAQRGQGENDAAKGAVEDVIWGEWENGDPILPKGLSPEQRTNIRDVTRLVGGQFSTMKVVGAEEKWQADELANNTTWFLTDNGSTLSAYLKNERVPLVTEDGMPVKFRLSDAMPGGPLLSKDKGPGAGQMGGRGATEVSTLNVDAFMHSAQQPATELEGLTAAPRGAKQPKANTRRVRVGASGSY